MPPKRTCIWCGTEHARVQCPRCHACIWVYDHTKLHTCFKPPGNGAVVRCRDGWLIAGDKEVAYAMTPDRLGEWLESGGSGWGYAHKEGS